MFGFFKKVKKVEEEVKGMFVIYKEENLAYGWEKEIFEVIEDEEEALNRYNELREEYKEEIEDCAIDFDYGYEYITVKRA